MGEQRYFWLKLNKDFFKSKRIKKLRKLAGGDTFTIIYLKMQLLATPTEGVLTYTGLEDSAAEEIALDIDEDPENVKITLNYMLKTGLCEMISENEILLTYVAENVGSEGSSAKRMRDLRARNKEKPSLCDNIVQTKCALHYGEIEIEKDIEKDINILSSKVEDVVSYLNKKTGKNFRASTKGTQKHIKARLSEGYSVEDFYSVIDVKCNQWLEDRKMSAYLRPETLFAPGHFEAYLNEAPKRAKAEEPKNINLEKVVDIDWDNLTPEQEAVFEADREAHKFEDGWRINDDGYWINPEKGIV